nr:YodL domain-containing protein [Ruminococcus flavefaciens]
MANSIPVGHYSQSGEQTINRMSKDDIEYTKFLKYFGRVFKHPVSVALEFYVNRPDAQFIASGNQWKRAGYQINPTSKGIPFLDTKGNEVTLYDFEDVIGDYPPKRWTITNRNVNAIRNELGLAEDRPLFSALDESAASAIDDLSLIQDLGLSALSNDEKLRFRNSYHNMIQMMIAGRLEINGARYNVQPDRAALEFCSLDEQRLMLLTSASTAARKALTSVEYAFDTLRTENNLRKEEQKNDDLRRMESSQRGTENASTRNGISADTERAAGERLSGVTSGEERRTAGMDNSTESRGAAQHDMGSGDNNRTDNIRGNNDTAAVSSQSDGRTVHTDDRTRTVTEGRTDRTVWQDVDGEHGEELSGESRTDDVLSQIPDGSSISGQESDGILRTAERSVRQEQSSPDNGIRDDSGMGENEEIRNRSLGNDGDRSRTGDNSLNDRYLNELISRVSGLTPVFNAVMNSDKQNAITEIKEQCRKTLTFMAVENLEGFGSFHDSFVQQLNDEEYINALGERIFTAVSNSITENDKIANNWNNLDVIIDNNNGTIDWAYYNPDSSEGGQLVVSHISQEQLSDAEKYENAFDYIQSIAKQELIDISAVDFADTANYYYELSENNNALRAFRTESPEKISQFLIDYSKKLDNQIENAYSRYVSSLSNTRFTKLSESQEFAFRQHRYVEAPENSIWGEVQGYFRINNGIFDVSTASHGGIMLKSDIARLVLSSEAQAVAQKEAGWYYFEEDCDYAVALRELLDKDLFDDIDFFFSRQYSKKTDEFFTEYSDRINKSVERYNSKYWDKREAAIYNALTPEEQAEKIGQLSFSEITDESDEAETTEIRNHAIESSIVDVQKRIERLQAANGNVDELHAQVDMLNFLQTALKDGVEITSDNFKAFVAQNSVATSSNENYFEIYQLKKNENLRYHRFTDYETLHKEGNTVEAENYIQVYRDELSSGTTLEDIYTRFNINQPADFKGHSLSVSDIIVVHDNGDTAAYYIDDVGYKRVPEFLKLEQKAENVVANSNEETAVVTSNSEEQAIHSGFAALYANQNYTEKQKQFLERLERFATRNNVTENIIDSAFERKTAFHNTYGNREYVSRNIFGRRLGSTERELTEAIKRNMGITPEKEPETLDEVIAKFFNSDSSEVRSADGTWSINYTDGVEYAEVYHNGNAACAVLLENDVFSVKPYEELSAVPAMVTRAIKASQPDSEVQLLQYERTFANDLEKAQFLINTFCESEYGSEADFSDMHSIGIAYTTLTDNELPVQVTADLIDHKITYEFDGEIYSTEQYSGIRDMVNNGLTGLDFDEMVSVPDDVIERHTQNEKDPEKYKPLYVTLSRCKQDCDYAINRAEDIDNLNALNKYMYGGDYASCINTMRDVYNRLPESEKPEWLSEDDIADYEQQLNTIVSDLDKHLLKQSSQALVSVEINGEISYFNVNDKNIEEIMNIANTEAPLLGYENMGSRISETEYAEIQQSIDFTYSVELNFDDNNVSIYSVNDGKGGIAEGDRTDDNIRIEKHKLSEYHEQNTELNAKGTVSNEVEQLTDEKNAMTLADVEVGDILLTREPETGEAMYFRIDNIQGDFSVSMTRVTDASGNDFTELGIATKGIIDGHWKETLLDENTDFPIVRFTKNYQEELRNINANNTVIDIPEYGIIVDLKDINSFVVEDTHYIKDNNVLNKMLSIELTADGTAESVIITEGSDNKLRMSFDLSDKADKKAIKDLVTDFISKSNELNVYSLSNDEDLSVKETFDITAAQKDVAAVINDVPRIDERPHKRASRAEMLYREFTEAYPDIANGTHTHERYGDYDEYSENDADEPLSLESLGDDTYAYMTWYIQNGDLMRDPDFVFTLDHEKKELHVWEYQMDGVPSVGTVYQRVELDDGTIDTKLQAALEENFRLNLRNAIQANRKLSAYTDVNGEEHELQGQEEKTVDPELPEIHDESAYYREILNEFSEKHGLGELNIKPNDIGFHVTEKFKDGISAPIWYISKNNSTKPLTPDEVSAELTAFEKAAEKNNTSVSEYGYRSNRVKEHGGISELPPVQDNLPEIKYADNPIGKVRDNITAIREMQRLEICEERGRYPYEAGRNAYNGEEASMERLRRYSGWGGVSQVFDERYAAMANLRGQLKELLTAEEYAAARSSTLTSHYTPQVIIDEMFKTIRNMGLPENSRILEPSCGTGNFISHMPHDMGKGGIVGVELDPITAKIAKHLNVPKPNPYAKKDETVAEERDIKILNCGFERSNLENNSFDAVIGNVPFGDYKLNDPDYTNDWLIHDAFFRKALDKVAPGGIVAFITSSGTLDKKNPKVREQLSLNADLIGAVRLPNNAFADADTKVTSDIIFLQKRKTPRNVYDPKPEWCYTSPVEVEMVGKKYEGEKRTAYINSYFAQNPQMVLGTIKQTTHFDMLTCEPNEGRTLQEQLETAFRQLNAKISIDKRERSNLEKQGYVEPWGKSFTYQVKDDKVYYNLGNAMEEVEGSEKKIAKLKSLCELRDIVRELLNKQQTYVNDEELVPLRNKLNAQYDKFVKDNGELNSKAVKKLFSLDSDYPILAALEKIDPDTKEVTKTDIFTRRTVNPVAEIKAVESAEEAMQVSLDRKGRVDIYYMATLLQNKYEDTELSVVMEDITNELLNKGQIFRDPEKIAKQKPYAEIVDKSEYLCGNVRRKLVMAEMFAKNDSRYNDNVEALKAVIPEDIGAAEISVDLGCTWIDTADYEDFMRSLSGRTEYDSRNFGLRFSEITGKFSIENARTRNQSALNPNEVSTYGTEDMNMYHILENLLNQKKIQVFDYFPDPQDPKKVKSVLNKNKTQIAQSKAKAIKGKFSEWIFATEERKEKYVRRYNEKFNNLVGRSYDGSHLTFSGMADGFKLRPHQLDCVARTIYGGNTLAAHCVGAGKSAVIAASVMKKKELGLIHKACVVVPKPLTEQTEREWRTSFPDAKLLVVDNKDLSDEKKRELFTARVATGDYDAIIMSQEQYEKLPMSDAHRLDFLNKQKAELLDQLAQSKRENGRRDPTVKEIERLLKQIESRIDAITNPKSKSRGKDSLLNFESLGFDYLVVDEAHAYKNGFVSTKMGDVSGVNTRESGRAGDMQMKCDYFNSEFGNGHILYATGTPVSNSMTELYVMTRYLRPDLLEDCGCSRFDDWAATFGQIKTQNKKTATGELKLKTCFAGFKNRPELIKMYKDFADLVTKEKITQPDKDGNAPQIKVPNIKGGKPQIIEVEASPEQREIVKDFARRGREIQLGNVRPDQDNLLKITGEARLVGLGNKAVASVYEKNGWELPIGFAADDKSGKIDECVKNVATIYNDRYDKNAVQIIFSDIAVNSDDGKFSAYEYIRDELIAKGIKEDEIIFAPKSDAKNRADIFRDINEAKYRVVIASTGTLGTGANIQKNLYALHHLDIPWRPSDFAQREGRIVRQGNLNDEVEIYNYVTKGTLDSYLYQGVTDKARGIAQLWNDTCISRTAEDIDEKVLTFGELEAAAEGNPKLREYSELKNKIDELQVVRAEYNRETTRIERRINELPESIESKKSLIAEAKKDLVKAKEMQTNGKVEELKLITHNGQSLTDRKAINNYIAGKVQLKISRPLENNPPFKIGKFDVTIATSADRAHPDFAIKGERTAAYRIGVGVGDNADNCQRLMNFFDNVIEKIIEKDTQALHKDELDLEQAKVRVATSFPSENEYQDTLHKFETLETELTMGGYLDSGEEIAGAEDFGDFETEPMEINSDYDENDLTQDEYNSTI